MALNVIWPWPPGPMLTATVATSRMPAGAAEGSGDGARGGGRGETGGDGTGLADAASAEGFACLGM